MNTSVKILACYLITPLLLLFANSSFGQKNTRDETSRPVATASIRPEGAQDVFHMKALSETRYAALWKDDRRYPAQIRGDQLTLGFVFSVDEDRNATGGISFILPEYRGPGTYTIEGAEIGSGNIAVFQAPDRQDLSSLYGSAGSGRGTIALRGTNAGQLEGSFDLILYNTAGDQVNISQGRFRVTPREMPAKQ